MRRLVFEKFPKHCDALAGGSASWEKIVSSFLILPMPNDSDVGKRETQPQVRRENMEYSVQA